MLTLFPTNLCEYVSVLKFLYSKIILLAIQFVFISVVNENNELFDEKLVEMQK